MRAIFSKTADLLSNPKDYIASKTPVTLGFNRLRNSTGQTAVFDQVNVQQQYYHVKPAACSKSIVLSSFAPCIFASYRRNHLDPPTAYGIGHFAWRTASVEYIGGTRV